MPTHFVLRARFEMPAAVLPARGASSQLRQAMELGAVVLDEDDHKGALEELENRV